MNEIEARVEHYMKLVEKVFHSATQANIDRVEAYERAYPWVIDEAYKKGQKKDLTSR